MDSQKDLAEFKNRFPDVLKFEKKNTNEDTSLETKVFSYDLPSALPMSRHHKPRTMVARTEYVQRRLAAAAEDTSEKTAFNNGVSVANESKSNKMEQPIRFSDQLKLMNKEWLTPSIEGDFDRSLLPNLFYKTLGFIVKKNDNQTFNLNGWLILRQAIVTCFTYERLFSKVVTKNRDKGREFKLKELSSITEEFRNNKEESNYESYISTIITHVSNLDKQPSVIYTLLSSSIQYLDNDDLSKLLKVFVKCELTVDATQKDDVVGLEWFKIIFKALEVEYDFFSEVTGAFDEKVFSQTFEKEVEWVNSLCETLKKTTAWPDELLLNYFNNGFPGADSNKAKRYEMAKCLSGNPFAKNINLQSKKFLIRANALYGICCSLHYWFLNRVKFSKDFKRNSNQWANKRAPLMFATKYATNVRDPGRLAITGVSYTTMSRGFRDHIIPLILKPLRGAYKTVYVDIAGCHGKFQAAIAPEPAPYIFDIFKNNQDVWKEVLQDPSNNLKSEDKPLLKIVFYAACNGANIKGKENIARHLKKANLNNERFIEALAQTNFYKDLVAIGEHWSQFTDGLYVPTETELIMRDSTHKLSSPVYTSLEFLFITKIQLLVFKFCNFQNVTILQGVHDGTIFLIKDPNFQTEALGSYIQKEIESLSKSLLRGILMNVSVMEID